MKASQSGNIFLLRHRVAQLTEFLSAEFKKMATGAGRYKTQVTGHRSQVTGHTLQVTGHRLQVTGYRLQVTGHRSQVTENLMKKVRHSVKLSMFICLLYFRLSHNQAYVWHGPCFPVLF